MVDVDPTSDRQRHDATFDVRSNLLFYELTVFVASVRFKYGLGTKAEKWRVECHNTEIFALHVTK